MKYNKYRQSVTNKVQVEEKPIRRLFGSFVAWFHPKCVAVVAFLSVVVSAVVMILDPIGIISDLRQNYQSGFVFSAYIVQGQVHQLAYEDENVFMVQAAFPVVISNTGQTEGSVLAGKQADSSKNAAPMKLCFVNLDESGRVDDENPIRQNASSVRIGPNESVLALMMSRKGAVPVNEDGSPDAAGAGRDANAGSSGDVSAHTTFVVPSEVTLFDSAGRRHKVKLKEEVPIEVNEVFRKLNLEGAAKACAALQ